MRSRPTYRLCFLVLRTMRDDSTPIATAQEGWSMRPLKELCSIISGGTPSKSNPEFWRGSIPWVSGKDLKRPMLDDAIDHISEAGLADGSRLAPAGAVFLLVRGMGLAKGLPIAVARRPMAFNQDVKALIPRGAISGEYLRAALFHARDRLLSRIVPSAHGTMTLSLDDVETFEIPVPDNESEASAVERALGAVMLVQNRAERGMVVVDELKRATMQALFTRGLKGEAQRETEIGILPESWELSRIDAHFSVVSGGTPSRATPEYWTSGTIPWVKTAEINYGLIESTEECITLSGLEKSATKLLPAGTLLLAMYGQGVTRGRVAILGIDATCNQACAALSPIDELLDIKYLYHFLTYRYESIRQLAHGGQQQNLNLDIVRGLPVAFPNERSEQNEIVAILDAIDRKIDLHRRQRAVLNDLFNALLHKLMTGEIRIADLDLSVLSSAPITGAAA